MTMYQHEDKFFTYENPNIHKLVMVFREMREMVEERQVEIDQKADILEAQYDNYERAGLMHAYDDQMKTLEESYNRLEKRRAFWSNCEYLAANAESDFREQLARARSQNPDIAGELDDLLGESA